MQYKRAINLKLTPELLREISEHYTYASEVTKNMGFSSYDIKRAFEHHKINYPFERGQWLPYKPESIKDEDFFSREDEKSFYWAGFWAADGYIRENKRLNGSITYFVSCGLSTDDKCHLERFKEDLGYSGKIYDRIIETPKFFIENNETWEEYYYMSSIEVVSKKLFDDLHKFGMMPAKTYTYKMPDWLVEHDMVNHFIRGYIDGDGTIRHKELNDRNDSLVISLVGAGEATRQIYDILHKKCKLRRGGYFRQAINDFGTLMSYFGFASIYDFKLITDYIYKDHSVCLERKREPLKLIDGIMENSRNYFLDEVELQALYDKLGSFSAVARELEVPNEVVARTIHKYGTRVNTQEEINDNKREFHFDADKLRAEYEEHQSCTKLAEIYGCSIGPILLNMKKFGIKHRARGSNFTDKKIDFDKDTLERQYNELRSHAKVAELYSCSGAAIHGALKRFGIKSFPPTGPKIKYVFDKKKLKDEYDRIRSLGGVAKIYGCDKKMIKNAMDNFGLPYERFKNQFNTPKIIDAREE